MDAIRSFFAMGGYALYVWPAFALTAGVLAGLLALSRRALRAREAELARMPDGHNRRAGGKGARP